MICQAAFLKGKVICWNLSQATSRTEPPKVIGHVFRETDAMFPDTVITYVHGISQIIFYWAKKTRAANVKDEMTCFIYFCKCYHHRETMERAIGLHTPQEAQHVLSDSQRLVPEGFMSPFWLPSDWSCNFSIFVHYLYQIYISQIDIPIVMDVILWSAFVWLCMLNNKVIFLTWFSCVLSW